VTGVVSFLPLPLPAAGLPILLTPTLLGGTRNGSLFSCSISSEAILPRSDVLVCLISPEGSLDRLDPGARCLPELAATAVSTEFSLERGPEPRLEANTGKPDALLILHVEFVLDTGLELGFLEATVEDDITLSLSLSSRQSLAATHSLLDVSRYLCIIFSCGEVAAKNLG
jgi:hypothetical protein